MFKGIVYCEASLYVYSSKETHEEEKEKYINFLSNYTRKTIKITSVSVKSSGFDSIHQEQYTRLSVLADVLVPYDPVITHLNDYRVKGCTEFRKHFPHAGAIMAHSIDIYNAYRTEGFRPF
ncbi:hypothetical protein [Alkalihalobacillus sp. LMS39]|uniref:hypothetical protein n=1 Tax=Alkalihalobacillus sp. LMS39 TaxID=2924032 RepID=UPI001FB4FB7B|nr:hypothetical protein [Alkalihalobacillus sp. LMS39]UOE92739.1 hypothetical protein MM271_16070 [Alkalihalobacillus sp. LMS39]